MIRILHTADLQIGKSFHWADERPRMLLRERRLTALNRIRELVVDPSRPISAVLVAGDLMRVHPRAP
jgi:DNA repair exonuclease SbcCD nuclease subunit